MKNDLLCLAYSKYVWAYAGAILLGYLTLVQIKLEKKMALFYAFVVLSLVPSMFIDERYYIIPLVFVLLFRKEFEPKKEYLLVFYFLFFSIGYSILLFRFGF